MIAGIKNIKNEHYLLSKSKVPKMYFLRAPASQNELKGTNPRLKHQSEQFWVAEKTYKGELAPKILRTSA